MTRFTKITAVAVASAALAAPIAQAGAASLTPAQTARLGAETEAIGFTNITRYLVQHGERTAAPNGSQTEAAGFKALARYQVEHAAETPVQTSAAGFAWGAALIGAALATGALLILGVAIATAQKRKMQPRFR